MYLPIMLDLMNKKILIIGGGKVALHKAEKILDFGGKVTLLSLEFLDAFYQMEGVELIQGGYEKKYIEDASFVIVATSNRALNAVIYLDCKEKKILCNVVDDKELSDVIFPASFKRGELIVAVSTSGNSPLLAKKMIQDIKKTYDESYEEKIFLLGEIRSEILKMDLSAQEKLDRLSEILEWNNHKLKDFLSEIRLGERK